MTDKRGRIGGWAAGNYQIKCTECKQLGVGDKRAILCERCALRWQNAQLQAALPAESEIKEILARAEAADAGPWTTAERIGVVETSQIGTDGIAYGLNLIWARELREEDYRHYFDTEMEEDECDQNENIDFIAHARTDVPRLCKALLEVLQSLPRNAQEGT